MKRYYADPLEAAYMAKHHGMKFDWYAVTIETGERSEFVWSSNFYEWMALHPLPNVMEFHIHSDSLHLLEPMEGDLLVYSWKTRFNTYGEYIPYLAEDCQSYKIIQRNGKAFFWPMEEA